MESQAATKGMFLSFPQTGPTSIPQGSTLQTYQWKAPLQKFLRGEPKALGAVQIMIALMNLGIGVIVNFFPWRPYGPTYFLKSGYIFWGPAFFIISGSLSIAAENRTTSTLVQCSLVMNTISSVVAGIGIIFFSIYLRLFDFYFLCYEKSSPDSCNFAESVVLGNIVFLLILNVLEFAVSLVISIFACKPFCCAQSGVTIFMSPSTCVSKNSAAEACKGGASEPSC
ncbi:membrane-spanning 4-domains subfamily A member 4A-like [Notamacropus eugenii]|uniref:membrane-spanning 4-domains subfamily A member 4A-like n=1 Tax=Notamacropus eugenii TaxID=9315 RepID=UPI003B6773F5